MGRYKHPSRGGYKHPSRGDYKHPSRGVLGDILTNPTGADAGHEEVHEVFCLHGKYKANMKYLCPQKNVHFEENDTQCIYIQYMYK